jgi:hypothetical protein
LIRNEYDVKKLHGWSLFAHLLAITFAITCQQQQQSLDPQLVGVGNMYLFAPLRVIINLLHQGA